MLGYFIVSREYGQYKISKENEKQKRKEKRKRKKRRFKCKKMPMLYHKSQGQGNFKVIGEIKSRMVEGLWYT